VTGELPFDTAQPGARLILPEFPDGLRWVNRREPLQLADLRGRIVLLVFWNGSSASSANLLDELRILESRFPGAFAIVSVHTPRYDSQQSDAVVLKAVHRLRLRAPVANDSRWQAWKRFAVTAWPTLLVIDPEGGLAARLVGEGRLQEIEDAVMQMHDPSLARPMDEVRLDVRSEAASALLFPSHALATPNRLFVSDTGHHRVLECTLGGRVLRQFGSGTPGNWDGQMGACGFQSPQGLAIDRNHLYIADTGNHCVRRIRLDTGEVDTVLGMGRPAFSTVEERGSGLRVGINSPRGVAADGDVVYVAASGQHQILRVSLRDQRVETLAGDGRNDVRDGIGGQSSLAQPSGLALMPGQLLIADAGGNAIRRLRFADLALTTLAGASPWEPGNRDGVGADARFAFPSSLAVAGERVYIADSCNDRLCVLDPYGGSVKTLPVNAPLHEPQGISFAAGALWVADRNDHAILRIDPERGTCERVPVDE
jgi:DNA-binding beta-propeller fold protein YncE